MTFSEIDFDEASGYPIEEGLFYKCTLCNVKVSSTVENAGRCDCRNIRIDSDAGRVAVRKLGTVKLLKYSQ